MKSGNVQVVARFRGKPGMEETLRKELLKLVAETTREDGCITYDLHRSDADPALFMFYEIWRSREDLERHLTTPHILAFRNAAGQLLAEPGDVSLWEMVT